MLYAARQNTAGLVAKTCPLRERRNVDTPHWSSVWIGLLICLIALSGCSPRKYRLSADRETYGILASKTADPRWSTTRLTIDPASNSRLADPFNPDCPPMPPDDPIAQRDMHCPGGINGYRHWHENGDAPWVENPEWRELLVLSEDGSFALTRDSAVELALVNSREYQSELEDLYLACLSLTLQRFEFSVQWFFVNRSNFFHFGAGPNDSNTVSNSGLFGFRKAFASGGQLLATFSNSLVLQFSGTDSLTVRSNIGVDLVQPLLRNAGRNIRLESLTQAERNVLYAARDFARFRKQFYFDVTSGNVGYLALLERVQNIRNFEANLVALEQDLIAHQALNEAGVVSRLQVDQVFQGYQNGRISLIRAQNQFQNALDVYKVRLGLPPELELTLDESQLSAFQFMDRDVNQTSQELTQLLTSYRQLETPPNVERLRFGYQQLAQFEARIGLLLEGMPPELATAQKPAPDDLPAPEREWYAYRSETLNEAKGRLIELTADLKKYTLATLNAEKTIEADNEKLQKQSESLQKLINQHLSLLSELDVLKTRIRAYHIELPPNTLTVDAAVQIALENRLDLMNQRAQVVDAWRNIQVSANRLKGILDVTLSGDIATEAGSTNPFNFSNSASGYRAGLLFDTPLNRQAERNAYRAQLIQYQRIRRRYMAVEDQIVREVRRDIRDLETNRINFEIARQSVITAARQVEEARDQLLLPGPSNFFQTQDSLNALNSMLQSKNALISIWVNYETARVQLLLDLEALQPDPSVEPADFYLNPNQESP